MSEGYIGNTLTFASPKQQAYQRSVELYADVDSMTPELSA